MYVIDVVCQYDHDHRWIVHRCALSIIPNGNCEQSEGNRIATKDSMIKNTRTTHFCYYLVQLLFHIHLNNGKMMMILIKMSPHIVQKLLYYTDSRTKLV